MSTEPDAANPDVMIRCLWLAGHSASFIRKETGLGIGALGAQCALLGLPIRDHKMRPVMGVACSDLPRFGVDKWVEHRRRTQSMA